MNRRSFLTRTPAVLVTALALAVLPACDENSSVRDPDADGVSGLVITPAAVELRPGATVSLAASGGIEPYTWAVETAALGTLNPDDFRTSIAQYTAGAGRGLNAVRVRDSHNPPWSATVTIVQE